MRSVAGHRRAAAMVQGPVRVTRFGSRYPSSGIVGRACRPKPLQRLCWSERCQAEFKIMSSVFHRGDPHPDKPGLFYWGKTSKGARGPVWVTTEKLKHRRVRQNILVKRWQAKNPEKTRASNVKMKAKRKERNAALCKAWKKRNPERWKALKYRHHKKRRETDTLFVLICRMRTRIRSAFKATGWKKKSRTFRMLGCTPDQLRAHIEVQFKEGMSWERFREIHIDHIKPVSSARSKKELISLFRYTNLQPMWARDNQAKGSKISA